VPVRAPGRSGKVVRQGVLERGVRADEDEIDGQDDAVVVLDEVGGMRIEGRHFIKVAIEGERAGIAEVQTDEGLEPELAHEVLDFPHREAGQRG